MSASSSSEQLPSKKFASIYASLPPDAQRALLEQHLLPLLDKTSDTTALSAAETLKTRFLGLPSLRLTERTRLTSRLIHDLERAPHHAALLDELCDTLALWCQDIFSVVFEYRTGFREAHECLLVMSKVVGEAGEACMGVAGCHCATTQLPFDVVFDRRRTGKRVRHVQCSGLDAFEVKVLRWLWREVCVGVVREEGEDGEERVMEWLGDVEDWYGWRGVVGVLYGGRTRWDDVDDEFEDEDEVLDDDEDPPSDEEEEEEEEIVSDDGAEGWEDDSSISLPHPHLQRSDPFVAPHWPSALISHSPILHTLAISHLTALFARAPCAELFRATTTLSPSSHTTMLANIEKTALSAPGSLAPSLAVLLHEPFPDAPRIWSLLESGRHLLRPRDAPTLQHIASTLGSIASERKKSQELVSRELIQSARSVHASLLTIFPRLDDPRTKKDLARILRTPAGEINRAQAIRDWVRMATRGVEIRGPGGMGMNVNVEGLGNIGVGVGAGPGAAQMAALAQMMGFPVPAEALEVVEEDDAAMAMGLGVRSREERAEMALLKERFHGWVDVAVALGRSQVLLIKAYHDMGPFMPYIKDTEVCAGVMSALADRAADSTLDALDALDSFAKAQRKREAALKARKEKEEARKKKEAAGEAGPSSSGSGSAGGKKTKTSSTSRASGSGSTSTSAHPSASTSTHSHTHNHPPPPHPLFSFGWTAPPHAGESDDDDMPPLEPIGGVTSSSGPSSATAPPAPAPPMQNPGPQFFVNPAIANAFGPGSGGFVNGAGPTPTAPNPNNPHPPHAPHLPPHNNNPLAAALSAMFGLAMNQALNVQGAGGEGDEGGDSDSSGEGPPALMPAERDGDSDGEMPALERVGGGGGGVGQVETGYHGIEDVD